MDELCLDEKCFDVPNRFSVCWNEESHVLLVKSNDDSVLFETEL